MKTEIDIAEQYSEWEVALGLRPAFFPMFCDHDQLLLDCKRCETEPLPHPSILIGRIQEQVSLLPDSPAKHRIGELLADLQRAILERDLEASLRYLETRHS